MATGMDLLMTAVLAGCCLLVLMRSPPVQQPCAAGAVQIQPQPGQRCDYGQQPHYFLQVDHAWRCTLTGNPFAAQMLRFLTGPLPG